MGFMILHSWVGWDCKQWVWGLPSDLCKMSLVCVKGDVEVFDITFPAEMVDLELHLFCFLSVRIQTGSAVWRAGELYNRDDRASLDIRQHSSSISKMLFVQSKAFLNRCFKEFYLPNCFLPAQIIVEEFHR